VCCAVVTTPRANFVTLGNANGRLAVVGAVFAAVPEVEFVIEVPFVAEKAVPAPRGTQRGWLMPCIRNIVYRRYSVAAAIDNAVIASLFAGRVQREGPAATQL
jgi:hypothetical protein